MTFYYGIDLFRSFRVNLKIIEFMVVEFGLSYRNYLIIYNPVKHRSRKVKLNKLQHYLSEFECDWQLYGTDKDNQVNKMFLAETIHQFTDIIVVGGDGTFHNVINSLPSDCGLPIGLLPAGTGNDFARWLYGKKYQNTPYIFSIISGNHHRTISLGRCKLTDGTQRLFHNVLGMGFDSMLAKELTGSKGASGQFGYLLKAVQKLPFYQAKELEFIMANEHMRYDNLVTAFANGKYFGGGMKIAPSANPLNEYLHLCRIEMFSRISMFTHLFRLFNGSHVNLDVTDYREIAKSCEIKTVGIEIQADGEYIGQTPCVIDSKKNALKLKMPSV